MNETAKDTTTPMVVYEYLTHKDEEETIAGRFFGYRLYPLNLWEISPKHDLEKVYARLLSQSGFPEPYFAKNEVDYKRWSTTHLDLILRQDLLDLENVRNISKIETLIALLQTRVGSSISYASLAKDLEVDAKTVKNWLTILENFFIIFKVSPYHQNIAKSILKELKYYFFDVARVRGDEGVKFENLTASALKKQIDYLHDTKGIRGNLFYLRTKSGAEIDFCVQMEDHPSWLIECKLSDEHRHAHFEHFFRFLKNYKALQLVKNVAREKHSPTDLKFAQHCRGRQNSIYCRKELPRSKFTYSLLRFPNGPYLFFDAFLI